MNHSTAKNMERMNAATRDCVRTDLIKRIKHGKQVYKNQILSASDQFTLSEDIYGIVGNKKVLILSKEHWEISKAELSLLANYRLVRPIDETVVAKHQVNLQGLGGELSRIQDQIENLQLPDFSKSIQLCKRLVAELSINKSMINKITMLRTTDPQAFDHSVLTAFLMVELGSHLRFDYSHLSDVFVAGLFHNIGNLYIDEKARSQQEMTPETKKMIETHPIASYHILKTAELFSERVLTMVLQHHEYLDGSGYPLKLSGDQISDDAKLLNVVSTYCALIRNGKGTQAAIATLEVCAHHNNEAKNANAAKCDPKSVMLLKNHLNQTQVNIQASQPKPTDAKLEIEILLNEGSRIIHYLRHMRMAATYFINDCSYHNGKEELIAINKNANDIYQILNRSGLTMLLEAKIDAATLGCELLQDAAIIMPYLLRHIDTITKMLKTLHGRSGMASLQDIEETIEQLSISIEAIAHHALHMNQVSYLHA